MLGRLVSFLGARHRYILNVFLTPHSVVVLLLIEAVKSRLSRLSAFVTTTLAHPQSNPRPVHFLTLQQQLYLNTFEQS